MHLIRSGLWAPDRLTRRQFAAASLGLIAAGPAAALQTRQTVAESPMGPFYPVDRMAESDADLTQLAGHSQRASGTVIQLLGRVLDVKGNPVSGASLELWQANAAGRYLHQNDPATAPLDPHFQGFGAIRSDAKGEWRVVTIKPGGYDSPIGHRPPHIHFDIHGRRDRTVAQLYFPEDAAANERDRLYAALGKAASTSLADRDGADPNIYRWDIILADS